MSVLSVRDACKSFGSVQALHGASIDLREGELLGLLGPNGAGKTTLLRAIAGRVDLNSGTIQLFGRTLGRGEPRTELGIVPQEIALYPLLSARENLEVFGRLYGVAARDLRARVDWALEHISLADRASDLVRTFSGGMRRRLNIACGILHRPRVILLDEPTAGVDPQSRERIYDMLATLRASGVSILLTTHHLEEAEARCGRIVIIDHGRAIASGTLQELVEQTVGGGRVVRLSVDRVPPAPIDNVAVDAERREVLAQVCDVARELPPLLLQLQQAGCQVLDVDVRSASLQTVFIHLTGRELRE
jgi:ABC-2 type transport system ATP-binding protein